MRNTFKRPLSGLRSFKGREIICLLLIFIFSSSNLMVANAEPFYYLPNLMSQIRKELKKRESIKEKLDFLDSTYAKMEHLENKSRKFILSDIKDFKRNFIYTYLREYTQDRYLTGTGTDATIKETRKYYQSIKMRDIKADIHPNYLAYLEEKIREKPVLDEESAFYKTYIYVLFNYLRYKDSIVETTESRLSSMGSFGSSKEFMQDKDYYKSKFEKFYSLEKPNLISKNDFTRIYSKISSQKISPGSDYMKGFLYWYATYKDILGSSTIMLNMDIEHTKQAYPLSCEANSAKDLLNHYNLKDSKELISEDRILNDLPSFTGALSRDGSGTFLWEDPSKMFVGQLNGKQSSNPNNFSGYGVYADPIVKLLNIYLKPKNLIAKKTGVDEKTILESMINGNPVVFWYLTPVIKGKGSAYETKPIIWKTPSGKTIRGYLGEHTGIMVGADISTDGKIENIYYFEGKKQELQKMQYQLFRQTTSFFNEMITVEETQENAERLEIR